MLDWILNPTGTPLSAYLVLWAALAVIVVVSIVWGVITTIRNRNNDR